MTAALRARDYLELLQVLDARHRALGMTMEAFDERSGLTGGYSAKLFSGMRRFGEMSLPTVLDTLGVDLLVVARDSQPPGVEPRTASCGLVSHLTRNGEPS